MGEKCNSKITNTDKSLSIEDQIFRLDILVNHVLSVQTVERLDDTGRNEADLYLCETAFPVNVVTQIATWKIIHQHEDTLIILKGSVDLGDKGRVQLSQDQPFPVHALFQLLGANYFFFHFFEGVEPLVLFVIDFPDIADIAFTNYFQQLEVF